MDRSQAHARSLSPLRRSGQARVTSPQPAPVVWASAGSVVCLVWDTAAASAVAEGAVRQQRGRNGRSCGHLVTECHQVCRKGRSELAEILTIAMSRAINEVAQSNGLRSESGPGYRPD